MGFLDGLEKLINEHGSATILKERLLLAADEYKSLERKFIELSSEIDALKQENNTLKKEKGILKGRIENQDDVINKVKEKQKSKKFLSEKPEKMLKIICDEISINEIQLMALMMEKYQIISFHIRELIDIGFIYREDEWDLRSRSLVPIYKISQAGKKYLYVNGLLV